MTDPERLDFIGRALDTRITGEFATRACLDDQTIAALAAGTLAAAERASALSHVAGCARCRETLASVARALSDATVAREVAALEGSARRRLYRIVLPVAAVAVLLLAVWPRPSGFVHRGPPGQGRGAPAPIAPLGLVTGASALRWSAAAGADRYRVTLFDAGGRVLYESQLRDTTVALPDTVWLAAGQSYLWKVEARTGWGRWVASDLVEFSIARGPPP